MIHYFNPGHETAVLNASKHYHPPAHVAKMQSDLASLPIWYASDGDYVLINDVITGLTRNPLIDNISFQEISHQALNDKCFQQSKVDLWGISPQSIHLFEKLNEQYGLSLVVPQWKEEFRFLGSRFASQKILSKLMGCIPEIEKVILPQFFSNIEDIEKQILCHQEKLLIKSPYSSSGRGLIWLPSGKLAQSERQILSGMIKKQDQVSIEKVLDKFLDFSMQCEITKQSETQFIGYSIFQTNSKGAYEKSKLDKQDNFIKLITSFIEPDLLTKTRIVLSEILQEMYSPHYTGIIGIDMMIYKSGDIYYLHPCVEINMRKNMGYLAIRLTEKHLHPDSYGEFTIEYNSKPNITMQNHENLQKQFPLIIENKRIKSGYLSLCPVTDETNYHSYIVVRNKSDGLNLAYQ